MNENFRYSYTVLRYIHDVMTGEFVNVGVVLFVPSLGKMQFRTRKSIGRIKGIFPDLDRAAFISEMRAVRKGLSRVAQEVEASDLFIENLDARKVALRALPIDDSSLQWSAVGTGLTNDPSKTFERLFERFVTRYDIPSAHRVTDEDVWRPVREKLAERNLALKLQEKVVVGDTDAISFKYAWKNGQWHAYEPVSLDLADAEGIKDKVRRWRGHLAAVADGPSEQFKLHFIVGAPQNPTLKDAYYSAVEILRKAPFSPEIYEQNQVDELVSKIENEFRSHEESAY